MRNALIFDTQKNAKMKPETKFFAACPFACVFNGLFSAYAGRLGRCHEGKCETSLKLECASVAPCACLCSSSTLVTELGSRFKSINHDGGPCGTGPARLREL